MNGTKFAALSSLLAVFGSFLMVVAVASAQTLATLKTGDGKIFKNAELSSVDSEFALIKHSGGMARVPLITLSKSARRSLNISPSLSLVQSDLELALAKIRIPMALVTEQYRKYLRGLALDSQQKGLLENVILVQQELESFPEGVKVNYGAFSKLEEMRNVYDAQLEKRRKEALNNIKDQLGTHYKELKEVEVLLTKAENLEQAIAARNEGTRIGELMKDPGQLLKMLGGSEEDEISGSGTSLKGYFILVASMTSDLIASVNLDSGDVKILYKFPEKAGPRGIAAVKSGTIYVALRYGGMNVQKMTPKEGADGGFDVEALSGRIGPYGPGKMRITSKGDLLIAGDAAGGVLRFDLNSMKPKPSVTLESLTNAVGIDVSGDEAFLVEVFGGRIAKLKLKKNDAKGEWLTPRPDAVLQRSTGIAVGHNKNLFVANSESSLIPEFSMETGELIGEFVDMKEMGVSMASDIRYVSELSSYFIMAQGSIFRIDTKGELLRKYPMPGFVMGGPAIAVIRKKGLSKLLADQL